MSRDEIRVRTPIFSFGISKNDNEIKLKEGETILLRYWSWRKLGYVRKALTLVDGKVEVQRLDDL